MGEADVAVVREFLSETDYDINFLFDVGRPITELVSVLKAMHEKRIPPFIDILMKKKKGERNDRKATRELKIQAGNVYRALRFSQATSAQALDIINNLLKKYNSKLYFTINAIQNYAPPDLLGLPPKHTIHSSQVILPGKKLTITNHETYQKTLERFAASCLVPYIAMHL